MTSLVTGGTGFIGKRLIDKLLARQEQVRVLVREQSLGRFETLVAERWSDQADLLEPVIGDIRRPLKQEQGAPAHAMVTGRHSAGSPDPTI